MLWAQQNHNFILFMGDIVIQFPKDKKEQTGKNLKQWFGPYKIQYYLPNNIVLFINIGKFKLDPILVNINNFKPYQYLGKAPKGLEATIKGGEHKEDSREDVQDEADSKNKEDSRENVQHVSTKKITQPKIIVNPKNPVDIREPIYKFTKLKRSFDSTNFGKNKLKNQNSTKRDKNSSSTINSNLESIRTNSCLECLMKDSTSESIGVDFKLFKVESSRADSDLESLVDYPPFLNKNFQLHDICNYFSIGIF